MSLARASVPRAPLSACWAAVPTVLVPVAPALAAPGLVLPAEARAEWEGAVCPGEPRPVCALLPSKQPRLPPPVWPDETRAAGLLKVPQAGASPLCHLARDLGCGDGPPTLQSQDPLLQSVFFQFTKL